MLRLGERAPKIEAKLPIHSGKIYTACNHRPVAGPPFSGWTRLVTKSKSKSKITRVALRMVLQPKLAILGLIDFSQSGSLYMGV